ncbi:MAG TPA: ATP-dependent DNA helicase RecG [Pirellulales bacterium]|nr:ATP-dependent DNA helicase RecG [Pirellulales bacterium]
MTATEKTAAELLATPVQFLKGVGPQRAELLERLGLRTARDLLFFFPRDYQDLTELQTAAQLEPGAVVRLRGVVAEVDQRTSGSGTHILGVLVRAADGCVRLLWFNQAYMRQRFSIGHELLITGKPKLNGGVWEFTHPRVQWLETEEGQPGGKLLPVYPLTEGLSQGQIRRVMEAVVPAYAETPDEVFPAEYLAAHDLWPLRQALPQIHFPADRASLQQARRRLIYQELLVLQLALAVRRRKQHDERQAPPLEATAKIDARIRRLFPFELTPGQRQAIDEVSADMARPHPMNRLLQGDVGSGKTMVAVYAMLLAVAHGHQAVLMAPTEVLARQHADTLGAVLAASRVRWAVLAGGLSSGERQRVLAQLAAGELDVVIGTQAIVQSDVAFAKLGLVVIDEQHKFGVRQRSSLKQSGLDPHYLVMTATPIPRTVAMTQFGDLDVSTLRDAPPGRQPVNTYLAGPAERERWWEFFRKKLREGRQGYVIVPLVEAAEDIEAASLDEAYESLAHGPLEAFRLGLLHGRMSSAAKLAAMEAFRKGETQALVATTVVEVGIDVPNATLMTIETGERFGLAQLHQLRGRVSRGAQAGFCCLFSETANDETRRRLEAFVGTTDGFKLAELDFELRGPGDLLGTRQHGLPPLRIADLVRDAQLLEEARRDAQQLVALDPGLALPEHERLRTMTLKRYGRVLELGDVG